jgi:hypothetical protein
MQLLNVGRASLARAIGTPRLTVWVGRNVAALVDSPEGPDRPAEPVFLPWTSHWCCSRL